MEELLKLILGSTGALVLLVVAVQWLNRDRDKLLGALTEERNSRIRTLEDASRHCSEDRMQMHKDINTLQEEVRGLYRRMLETKLLGNCRGQCLDSPPTENTKPQ